MMLGRQQLSAREELIRRARSRASATAEKRAAERRIPLEEVRRRAAAGDLCIVIQGRVYDLSGFDSHPGGRGILEQAAGNDVTDVYLANHGPALQDEKDRFCIGSLAEELPVSKVMTEYHEIDQRFQNLGWYQTDLSYYLKKLAVQLALFAVVLLPFWLEVELTYAWATLSACALGIFWQQLAFVGHDFGHNSVFHDRLGWDYAGSLLVTLFFGVSGQWWKKSHNCHHVVTNSIQGDPDIQHLPVFAVDKRQFGGQWSLYHKKAFVYDAAARFLVSWQHWLYIPIMCVARHNLYLQSYLMVLRDKDCRNWFIELLALLGYAWWMAELVLRFESGYVALYWWLICHAINGLLHVQITLSHFSMACHDAQEGTVHRSEGDDFVRHQLATSLDVDCPEALDWLHGGLQFQVVHHLWPRLPRHRLRRVRDEYLLPLCQRHGLQYSSLPFGTACARTLKHLKQQALVARRTPPGKLAGSMLAEAVNMEG